MSWVNAIKEFAKLNGGKYVIPKRDSEDYVKVKAIQERLAKGETIALPKAKKEKAVKKDNVIEKVEEVVVPQPRKSVVKKELVKKENVEVAPVEPVPDPVKKPRKSIPKPGKRENVEVEQVEVIVPAIKQKRVKPAKKENVEVAPAEPIPDPPKAPKKTAKEMREEKQSTKNKASEDRAIVRGQKALIDARRRMEKVDAPVTLDFS